ncbi:MAG: type II secretion system protein GspL [Burkholderiales bacterium]
MSTLLRLRIDSEWPAQAIQCEWALYDRNGRLVERGLSDPLHWPQAENCELMLSSDQCLALDAMLPKGMKRHDAQMIGYAVEEHLIGDIHHEHVVAGERLADGRTVVWVVSRDRLNALLAALRQLGRTPARAFSEMQLAPLTDDSWSVCIHGAKGFARLQTQPGFSFELAGLEPPAEICLAAESARANGRLPQAIVVYCAQEALFDADAWQAVLGVPVRREGDYAWQTWSSRTASNLLVGEFAPPRGRHTGWAPFRPAAAIGAAALVLYTVFSLGEWAWLHQRANQLRAETTAIFRAAFPEVPSIVDPVLQMQRLYDPLMRARGRVGESDFLPLLAAVSEGLDKPVGYRTLKYEEGRLEFTVTLKDKRAPDRLRETLARRGLMLTVLDVRPARSGIETTFSVRFGT